jgi:hypothetical protein
MFGWFKRMFSKCDNNTATVANVQQIAVPAKSPEEIARIRAHNLEVIKRVAIKLQAHKFATNPL